MTVNMQHLIDLINNTGIGNINNNPWKRHQIYDGEDCKEFYILLGVKPQYTKIMDFLKIPEYGGIYCYFFKPSKKRKYRCLYVGKAENIRKRVKDHLSESARQPKGVAVRWKSFFRTNNGFLNLYT
jgi:hypothetical protein